MNISKLFSALINNRGQKGGGRGETASSSDSESLCTLSTCSSKLWHAVSEECHVLKRMFSAQDANWVFCKLAT